MSDDGSGGPPIDTVKDLFADKYQIVEKLDWNGLALVYRAEREGGDPLALAVLPINTEGSPETTAAFKTKAAELQLLVEPGIVRVTGHGIQHGVAYLELEYEDATTLADELQDGPLERDQVLALTGELLDILGQAHAAGHFHWDLTPSNILLAPGMDGSEHVSVVGFGIQEIVRSARIPDSTVPTGRGSGPRATRYLAPELKDTGSPDARADVFGVAALVHHMLTGSAPGPGSTAAPADLADALSHGMAEDPENRPADAATFGFTLAESAAGGAGHSPSFAPPAGSMPAPFRTPAPATPDIPATPDVPAPAPVAEAAPAAPAAPEPELAAAAPEPEPAAPAPETAAPAAIAPEPIADAPAAPEPDTSDFAEDDATVVDARALSGEDLLPPVVAAAAPEAAPGPPEPPPPAPPTPPAPAAEDSDYESLAPPPADQESPDVDDIAAAMATIPSTPDTPPSSDVASADPFGTGEAQAPAPAPAPAQPRTTGPARDPFAPAPASNFPEAIQDPYGATEFAEEEKKRGSFLIAVLFLVLAIGLAVAFFMVRAGSGPPPELPTSSAGSATTD
ncbi:MAG: hypothetical protein DRJ42_02470 [Deltaproteobacteria bacterium]|nr:MAG: hypothetical protein DRJ42_02470 [Deltaproteobacteria bacterium]